MTAVNDRSNDYENGSGAAAPRPRKSAFKAAEFILIVGFEVLTVGLVFPLLLLVTFLWPTSFGHMGWHMCFSVSIFAAILGAVIATLRMRIFFPEGRTEAFRQQFWVKRQLGSLVIRFVSLAVPLVIAVQEFPSEVIWAAVLAFVVECILIVVGRSWRAMPDAATIEARRSAIQARREAQ